MAPSLLACTRPLPTYMVMRWGRRVSVSCEWEWPPRRRVEEWRHMHEAMTPGRREPGTRRRRRPVTRRRRRTAWRMVPWPTPTTRTLGRVLIVIHVQKLRHSKQQTTL